MTKIKLKYYLPILFAILFVSGMFLGAILVNINTGVQGQRGGLLNINTSGYDKINDIIGFISNNYVDSVDKDKLVDDAIIGLLSELDPHSTYITASEFEQMNEALTGNFEGIGIEFRVEHDTVVVLNTIKGGPSEKIGVKAGDRIIKVNDTIIAGVGINNQSIVKKLKGPKNTEVKVSILRKNVKDLLHFTIVRDVIPTYSVEISYMPEPDIGYILLSRFGATTYDEFISAVNKLRFKGMQKLIIDLRGNGGGYLNTAIQIADEFLEKKKLIVYTEGLNRSKKYEYATGNSSLVNVPFVILLDEWSASASEVLAGALQDNDKGTIVGRRSFGKGLVQEQIEMKDGSAIRLTVARYYTPTGRCIQRPYTENNDEYYIDFYKRFLDDSLQTEMTGDTIKFYTPGGKIVYGGGGITPDVIIEDNKEKHSAFYISLLNKGLIYEYGFVYADNMRDSIKDIYQEAKLFNSNFTVTNKVYDKFLDYVLEKGIVIPDSDPLILKDMPIIKIQLKAIIGRNLFSNKAFYPSIHKTDITFKKAVEILKNTPK